MVSENQNIVRLLLQGLLLTAYDFVFRLVLDQSKECVMESVGAYEAKTHLPKLLERVMKGERILITKHGVPVAVLQPPDPGRHVDVKTVISGIREFQARHTLDGITLKEMIEEGRK